MERLINQDSLDTFTPLTPPEEFFHRLDQINLAEADRIWVEDNFNEGNLFINDLNNPRQLAVLKEREPVSQHELAHAIAARSLGWTVTSIDVIPNGNILGVTHMVPTAGKSFKEILSDFITIALASYVGEEICDNHDHSGCGSDLFKAKYFATLYNVYFLEGKGSVNGILSDGFTAASRILGGSYREIHQNSLNLSRAGRI